jgi:hypothetical protein
MISEYTGETPVPLRCKKMRGARFQRHYFNKSHLRWNQCYGIVQVFVAIWSR